MMHFVRAFSIKAYGLVAIIGIRNYGQSLYIKSIFENGWCEDACSSFYPPVFAPGHKLQKPSKEPGIFQSLGTISFVLFTEKQSQKGEAMAECPPLNTLLLALDLLISENLNDQLLMLCELILPSVHLSRLHDVLILQSSLQRMKIHYNKL